MPTGIATQIENTTAATTCTKVSMDNSHMPINMKELHDAMARVDDDLQKLVNGDEKGAFARAYVEYVRAPHAYWEESATSVFAAAALEPGRLQQVQELFEEWQTRLIEHDELDPRLALLIRIACDGLWLIDLFGLAPPSTEQRAEVLDFLIQSIESNGTPD